jgi:hypothetical protein
MSFRLIEEKREFRKQEEACPKQEKTQLDKDRFNSNRCLPRHCRKSDSRQALQQRHNMGFIPPQLQSQRFPIRPILVAAKPAGRPVFSI